MADKNYDLIIVGSGMAGFLLAARIAEKGVNPRNGEPLHVALVERGPYLPGTREHGGLRGRWVLCPPRYAPGPNDGTLSIAL